MIFKSLSVLGLLFLLSCSHSTSQSKNASFGAPAQPEQPAPHFQDYPAKERPAKPLSQTKTRPVNFHSHPEAPQFRTLLVEGMKAGVNFAGSMTIITHGCGTDCQVHWVVDALTGNIKNRFLTELGIAYRPDSYLIILNPPTEALKKEYEKNVDKEANPFWKGMKSTYLFWDGNTFQKLMEKDIFNAILNNEYIVD